MKMEEIRQLFASCPTDDLPGLMEQFAADDRNGVRREMEKATKRLEALRREQNRMQEMLRFERQYANAGLICGIDEAGRGPLAGPVVAGAVILPKDSVILYLNDSKQLTRKKRETLYDVILKEAVAVGVGYASPERIDEINILQATYEAMREAIDKLSVRPDLLLNDAVTIPEVHIRQVPLIHGDARSASIAAASIVAKVTRDRLMLGYDSLFPEYGFASNCGYGAASHIEALKKYGPTPIHRKSFIGHFVSQEEIFGSRQRVPET